MNFALTDEQEFLKEAARGALSRFKTVEAAREALDGGELPDLWPTAQEAGWPGLLVSEEHGGAGLVVMEGMLVFAELGRVLAGVGLLGHLPATFLLDRGGAADVLAALADGRAARRLRAREAAERHRGRVDRRPAARLHARRRAADRRRRQRDAARSPGCPTRPAPTCFVVVGAGRPRGARAGRRRHRRGGRRLRPDPLARPRRFDGAAGTLLELGDGDAAAAWYVAQALLAAESLGAVEVALEVSVAVRQGALHVRARDRLLPGGQARPRGDPAAQRELALAHVLHGLGGPGQAGGVPARGVGVPARRGPRARPRGARPDLRPRRHRRDVGARRAAVLPPRAAVAAAAGRARRTPPTAWPASCSPPRARRGPRRRALARRA